MSSSTSSDPARRANERYDSAFLDREELGLIEDFEERGYHIFEIEDRSDGRFKFNHGTLYPILHKLESQGFIDGSWSEPTGKRKRRQYALTGAGRKHLKQVRSAWSAYFESFFNVIGRSEP